MHEPPRVQAGPHVLSRPAGPPEGSRRDAPAGPAALWHRLDGARGGLALDLGLYAGSAVFAAATGLTSSLPSHRAWGGLATAGYALAALTVAGQLLARRPAAGRRLLLAVTWLLVVVVPLAVAAVQRAGGRTGRAQEEVPVVEWAGARLLETGTPYLNRAAIGALPYPERLLGYLPYQPGMALFGLPRAVFGVHGWTDARVWFALATVACLAVAVRLCRPGSTARNAAPGRAGLLRALQLVTVLPLCALALATGGDDLPVLALCLLALALAARGRAAACGVAVGLAAGLKLLALPIVAVVLCWAMATGGMSRLVRVLPGSVGLPLLALVPSVLIDPAAVLENVVRFPLGHGLVGTPAQSPLPGQLIATVLPHGRVLAAGLLAVAALLVAGWLVRRPPRHAAAAAVVCATGLLVALLLMPSTRFGYLLYPIGLAAWIPVLHRAEPA